MTIGLTAHTVDVTIPYQQIEEITGISDKATVEAVWNAAAKTHKDRDEIVTTVISQLLDGITSSVPSAKPHDHNRSNSMETQTGDDTPQKDIIPKTVIDLTSDDDEVNKAIAASLNETSNVQGSILGGQITREDQDISRVLEASLADANPRGGSSWYTDSPYERTREDSWPVGLKNVGNTCWFNAVVQSLFYIEQFRELIINYTPTEDFAKDVSEFQHKLLDWLEEAFQHKSELAAASMNGFHPQASETKSQAESASTAHPESMEVDAGPREKDINNEMVKLFYGKVRTYGTNAGEVFTNSTDFGQWPLYVAGYSDIHESLEAGLACGDIETNSEQASTQEQWFTMLPPVLTFELSRFSFNAELTQAVKLHNKFTFPQTLYLDRYLDDNKEEVREKREKVKRLQAELKDLQQKLIGYTCYGPSDDAKYPLLDVLQRSMEFAKSGDHQEGSSTTSNRGCPQHGQPDGGPGQMSTVACTCSVNASETLPKPHSVSSEELAVFSNCISRWRTEILADMGEYEVSISSLKKDISQTYESNHLKKNKYQLHAVMVHEGEALSGHYWAYIYHKASHCWLKCNDISVTRCTWADVVKESVGGNGTASAYCLIYLRSSSDVDSEEMQTSITPQTADFMSKEEAFEQLPEDLRAYVTADNEKLVDEKRQWDERLTAGTQPSDEPDVISNSQMDGDADAQLQEVPGIETSVDDLAYSHAHVLLGLITRFYMDVKKDEPSETLELLVNYCVQRYRNCLQRLRENLPRLDNRHHVCAYILVNYGNGVQLNDIRVIIMDLLAKLELIPRDRFWLRVLTLAKRKSREYWYMHPEFQANYIKWHKECYEYRYVSTLFTLAANYFTEGKLEAALPLIQTAYMKNDAIIRETIAAVGEAQPMRTIDSALIELLRGKILQKLNDMAIAQFETEEDFMLPLNVMLRSVLPVLDSMKTMDGEENDLVSGIKERWVNYLAEPELDDARAEAIKDFLAQLFEPAHHPVPSVDNVHVPNDIGMQYRRAISDVCGDPSFISQ